jgi:hypothetical protein
MNRINPNPNSYFPYSPTSQGRDTALRADERRSTPIDENAGKRARGPEHYLARASQRPRTDIVETDSVETDSAEDLDAVMMDDYKKATGYLTDLIPQKNPVPNKPQELDRRKTEVKELIDGWDARLNTERRMSVRTGKTQKKLILTLMLKKIVGPADVTYAQACKKLRDLSSLRAGPCESLTKLAQVEYTELSNKYGLLGKPPKAYDCMALIALHKDLKDEGHRLIDLDDIAHNESNYGAILVLASNIMTKPPFASDSGGDERVEADRAASLSSIDGKVMIARYKGAFRTFDAILKHFPVLQKLGFLSHQIVVMGRNNSGATTINAVAENSDKLLEKDFTIDHIVKFTNRGCGKTNIELILEFADRLPNDEKTRDWMVEVVSSVKYTREQARSILRSKAESVEAHDEQETKTAEPGTLTAPPAVKASLEDLLDENSDSDAEESPNASTAADSNDFSKIRPKDLAMLDNMLNGSYLDRLLAESDSDS